MKHIQSITGDLDVCVTESGEVAIVVYAKGEHVVAKLPDVDELIRAARKADLIAMEKNPEKLS